MTRLGLTAFALAASLSAAALQGQQPREVDDQLLLRPPDGEWITYGRDQAETHHSPLKQIDQSNVARLAVAWSTEVGSEGKIETTPLVFDGVLYGTSTWSKVYAIDLRTGKQKWQWDPGLVRAGYEADGPRACCGPVNRGVALYKGRVYVGLLDGRLVALNAQTGMPDWAVQTTPPGTDYSITGAPRIVKGRVVIGQGGAEYGVRGFLAGYDAESGKLAWKFFVVPGDPAKGFEDEALARAAKTWAGQWWKAGGGGTPWDGIAYDPELNLIYVGTGNGSPWNAQHRSPGGGDNLYLSSIVALNADTGKYVWHYQTSPGDNWDFNAAQPMMLADLQMGNQTRKVIMQAPKNGFFYVLDRATGELLSARNYVFVNWTRGIDPKTGRPLPNPAADYGTGPKLVFPSMAGGHNWQPMSFSAKTGLVYIPVIDMPMVFVDTRHRPAGMLDGTFTTAGLVPAGYDPAALRSMFGPLPTLEALVRAAGPGAHTGMRGELRAWDPVRQRVVWSQPSYSFWDGGVMSTDGGLVFRGDAAGFLNVYAAADGQWLRRIDVGTAMMAAPMTYAIGNEQYVAFMAGYGGGGGTSFPPGSAPDLYGNQGRIVALKLGGGAIPKPPRVVDRPFVKPPALAANLAANPATLEHGAVLYNRYCGRCHVFGHGMLSDLRHLSAATHQLFPAIVLQGAYAAKGMGNFSDVLSPKDADAIHQYLISEAAIAYAAEQRTLQTGSRR